MTYEKWSNENALVVLNGVADSIVTIDHQGTLLFANEATEEMFGFTAGELFGRPFNVLMATATFQASNGQNSYIDEYLASGNDISTRQPGELIARKKDGSRFAILLTLNRMKTEGLPQFAGVIHDLTAQNAKQGYLHAQRERLARAGRLSAVGEMAASVAHEMNQPLTAIAMYAQVCQRLLIQPEPDSNELLNTLNKLSDQALRAGVINQQIQQFVRNDDELRVPVDINWLLEDIRALVDGDAHSHGIVLECDFAPELPEVLCVGLRIQQVVLGLLRNAFEAMEKISCANGSTVTLATSLVQSKERNLVEVVVIDMGPGVRRELEDTLFDPFVSDQKSGVGLGLSSCRSLIEEEGGDLAFRNRSPYGANFYFTLPAVVAK